MIAKWEFRWTRAGLLVLAALVADLVACSGDSGDASDEQASSAEVKAAMDRIDAVWETKLDACGCGVGTGVNVRSCSLSTTGDVAKANACADAIESMSCAAFKGDEYQTQCADSPCYFSGGWC